MKNLMTEYQNSLNNNKSNKISITPYQHKRFFFQLKIIEMWLEGKELKDICNEMKDVFSPNRVQKYLQNYLQGDISSQHYQRIFKQFLQQYANVKNVTPDVFCEIHKQILAEGYVRDIRKELGIIYDDSYIYLRIANLTKDEKEIVRKFIDNYKESYNQSRQRGMSYYDALSYDIGQYLIKLKESLEKEFKKIEQNPHHKPKADTVKIDGSPVLVRYHQKTKKPKNVANTVTIFLKENDKALLDEIRSKYYIHLSNIDFILNFIYYQNPNFDLKALLEKRHF